jgi:YesN/AraC family two-component response regulator
LAVAAAHLEDIDLLLSDVTMPGMTGPELAEKLTKKRSSLRVILMSGFSHAGVILQHGWRFIQKPFQLADIKKTVKEVL